MSRNIKNLIELSKAHPFGNYVCKRLHHTLADSSKKATNIKIPEYYLKADETFKNFAQRKLQQMKNNKIFTSIIDRDGEIIETKKCPEILICGGIEYFFRLKPKMRYTQSRSDAKNKIRNILTISFFQNLFCQLVSIILLSSIKKNLSYFSEYVYTENGLRLVLDFFPCLSQVVN